jgi:hypothetical protein
VHLLWRHPLQGCLNWPLQKVIIIWLAVKLLSAQQIKLQVLILSQPKRKENQLTRYQSPIQVLRQVQIRLVQIPTRARTLRFQTLILRQVQAQIPLIQAQTLLRLQTQALPRLQTLLLHQSQVAKHVFGLFYS